VKLNLDVMLLGGLYFFSAFFAIAFFFQRYRWRRRKRQGKSNWGFYPSSASLGNALQELSVMAQPQVEHVLEEKLNEDAEDDSEGGPENPVAHLHRQAAKIYLAQFAQQLPFDIWRRHFAQKRIDQIRTRLIQIV
jgi:hypothetical protein